MATVETAIQNTLNNFPGLELLIEGRGYGGSRVPPDTALPYYVVQKTKGKRLASHSGNSGAQDGRFFIKIYGGNYESIVAVSKQVVFALHGKKVVWDTDKTARFLVDDESDFYDKEAHLDGRLVVVDVWNTEATS